LASAVWKEKSDNIHFSDTTLTISRYYLEDDNQVHEKDTPIPNKASLEAESDEQKGRFGRAFD
jgi:hypothetical protein